MDEWQRPCVYLTQEQLLECVRHQGFDIVLVQPSLVPSLYTSAAKRPTSAFPPLTLFCSSNPNAMAHWTYHPVLFVAVKKRREAAAGGEEQAS